MPDTRQSNIRPKLHWSITLFIAVLMSVSVTHAAQTRTLDEFVRYSLYIATPLAAPVLAIAAWEWHKAGYRALTIAEVLIFPLGALLLIFIGAGYYSIAATLNDLYSWMQAPNLSRTGTIAVAIGATLCFGIALFFFRLKLRALYGVTETTVGLAVAAHRASIESNVAVVDPAFYLALLTAGVYLVVRGLDNVHQGLTKDPKDPAAAKIVDWLIAQFQEKNAEDPQRKDAA